MKENTVLSLSILVKMVETEEKIIAAVIPRLSETPSQEMFFHGPPSFVAFSVQSDFNSVAQIRFEPQTVLEAETCQHFFELYLQGQIFPSLAVIVVILGRLPGKSELKNMLPCCVLIVSCHAINCGIAEYVEGVVMQ